MNVRGLEARVKLLLLGVAGLWAVTLERPLLLGVLAGSAVLALCLSGAGWRRILAALGGLALALWGLALMQGFFYAQAPRTEIWGWHPQSGWALALFGPDGVALYREGFAHGLAQGLRVVLAAAAGLAVAFSTDPGALLGALTFFRVPYGLAFMAVTALRFGPLLAQEATQAWTAARLRGFEPAPWRTPPWSGAAVTFGLLRPVLAGCVRRAGTLAASIQSRGFEPAKRGVELPRRKLRALEWLLVWAVLSASAALLAAKGLYFLYAEDWYYRTEWRALYAFVREWT
ncbi:MAG: energy-coupling factor transporter transmembrane protein EcfT [Planctomycetes bacterium]|nr:energy-coupling factor transporter transmembrane protein EcfT [Planctomycetota bacterium]